MDIGQTLVFLRSYLLSGDYKSAEMLSSELAEKSFSSSPIDHMLRYAAAKLKQLTATGAYQQACELADCIHVLPDIAASENRSLEDYWTVYAQPYINKWKDSSLIQFKQPLLDMDKKQ